MFSEKQIFGNSLFWANYAGKHYGVCMKFNGEIIEAKNSYHCEEGEFVSSLPIEYCEEIPEFNYIRYRLGSEKKSSVQYYFGTKSNEWKYESEVRFIYENYNARTEKYPQVRFDTDLLEKVYLGCNLQETEINKVCEILASKEYQHVDISRLVKSKKSFQLIEQKIR
ncbi:MAG: DUF2971 domain-containing protein [Bacteroidetes bacterium]|nr:DUF2971 domain-containing protein [Bacteroidota bacterium]